MKLVFIRHAKVDMTWEKEYDAAGWEQANRDYNEAPIRPVPERWDPESYFGHRHYRLYVSALPRTRATAEGLLGPEIFQASFTAATPLLNEVPNRAFCNLKRKIAKPLWVAAGRVQWFLNIRHQTETRRETRARAEQVARMLEEGGEDAILVVHEFYLYTLESVFRAHGFRVQRQYRGRIRNLERITCER